MTAPGATAGPALAVIADYEAVHSFPPGPHGQVHVAAPPARLGLGVAHVAVKVLARPVTDAEWKAVADEISAVAGAASRHVVTMHEVGRHNGLVFWTMDYHALGTLAKPYYQPMPATIVLAAAAAARGLHALHEAGLAHRGVTPSNVLLEAGGARISDVNMSHLLDPGRTVAGAAALRNIEYTDRAILAGRPASRQTDVWALAATLHRAATGRSIHPLLPTDPLGALRHVADQAPVLDASLVPAVAEALWWALGPDPAARPPTALAFAERLEAAAQVPAQVTAAVPS